MKLLTLAQSAAWLGTTQENLRRMIDAAQVEAVTHDDRIFIEGDALHRALLEYSPDKLVAFEATAD